MSYSGRLFHLREGRIPGDPLGRTFERVIRPPGVRLLVLNESDELLLTREFRVDFDDFDLRLPGGKVVDTMAQFDAIADEQLEPHLIRAADRELREEAGMLCARWSILDCAPAGSFIEWDLWILQGHGPTASPGGAEPEPGEWVHPLWVSLEQARSWCLSGEIREDRSAMAILRLFHSRHEDT